jgi:hypothetical protein
MRSIHSQTGGVRRDDHPVDHLPGAGALRTAESLRRIVDPAGCGRPAQRGRFAAIGGHFQHIVVAIATVGVCRRSKAKVTLLEWLQNAAGEMGE